VLDGTGEGRRPHDGPLCPGYGRGGLLGPSGPSEREVGGTVDFTTVLIDEPAPHVRRVTLNRPEKRNALNETLRAEILLALQEGDRDPGVHVMILRGAGKCFSAGYDLSGQAATANGGDPPPPMPFYTAGGDGSFQRTVTNGWMSIWDLAKPVIAQVH